MHKQGDVVTYVEAGVETNALVISSSSRADIFPGQPTDPKNPPAAVEHLALVLVPTKTDGVPNLTPIAHGLFLRTVFGVRPAESGAVSGWKELVEGAEQIATLQSKLTATEDLVLQKSTELAQQDEKITEQQGEIETLSAAITAFKQAAAPKLAPVEAPHQAPVHLQ